ncbi:MAG TPA: hypothetical protein VFS08_05535 [Gemmatimonadaceae bacterium]|nr:hypothetical protein [Gemmatimonadaceae bacterium]
MTSPRPTSHRPTSRRPTSRRGTWHHRARACRTPRGALIGAALTAALAAACAPRAPERAAGAGDSGASPPAAADDSMPSGDMSATAPIRTDRTRYALRTTPDGATEEIVVVATYVNHGADTVFISPCGTSIPAWELQKREDGRWRRALSPVCTMIAAPPLAVAPGAERTDSLRIAGAARAGVAPTFDVGEIPGTYRLVYPIFRQRDGEFGVRDSLPVVERVSNEFEVAR